MTSLELRRLALRATRNPTQWLPVLQDALLERYGRQFENEIADARRSARELPTVMYVIVVYDPLAAIRGGRFGHRMTFRTYEVVSRDLDYTWPNSWVRLFARQGRSIAFVAQGTR